MLRDTTIMREALERYANGATGSAIAIKALTEVEGKSPYLAAQRELWAAQGAYGYRPSRRLPRLEAPEVWDGEAERVARREFARALREAWREIWAHCGAPITVVRVGSTDR